MRFENENRIATLPQPRRHVRALFLSDLHLGSRACKSDKLIEFLRHHRADAIYLVGDIVDGWRLRANWYWPSSHDEVLQHLLDLAREGVRVTYILGNHDEFLRDYCGTHFAGIEVADSAIHTAADGRRYVVVHGDQFDRLVNRTRRFAPLAHAANLAALMLNAAFTRLLRAMGLPVWSVSQWAKHQFKVASSYLSDFEQAVADLAHQHKVDGVICGHVHHATIHDRHGVRYMNCGDWIESCTAVGEERDGAFELMRWRGAASGVDRAAAANEAQAA
jgi:UDP-2,3-diacylglucosamine pyrophosphatase LpxH